MNLFFSIIIPTYNAEATLGAALESITTQNFRDYEVIIVDGVSKDGTADIVDRYAANNPAIRWVSEKDKGIYDAMNKGIGLARGEWLYFLGSDDILLDDQVLTNVHRAAESTDARMVYGNVLVKGSIIWAGDGKIYDGEFDREKIARSNISHQAIFYHKSVFPAVGNYNIAYSTCADWDLNLRCFARLKTQYVPLTIARFLVGGQSTNTQLDQFMQRDAVIRLKEYYHVGYFNRLYAHSSWQFWNIANDLLQEKKYSRSLVFLLYAVYHSGKKGNLLKNYLINLISPRRAQ